MRNITNQPIEAAIIDATPRMPETSGDWRNEPAGERQLSNLAELGATASQLRNLTKGQAAELMDVLQDPNHVAGIASDMARSQRDMATAQKDLVKAAKRHTNWQKNACGIVLLVILAPIWIPACGYIMSQGDPDNLSREVSPAEQRTVPASLAAITKTTQTAEAPRLSSSTVYSVTGGEIFHRENCSRLHGQSKESMTVATAIATNMSPCGICQPETPSGDMPAPKTNAPETTENYTLTSKFLRVTTWGLDGIAIEYMIGNGSPHTITVCQFEVTFEDENGNYLGSTRMFAENLGSGGEGIATALLSDFKTDAIDTYAIRIVSVNTDNREIDEANFAIELL